MTTAPGVAARAAIVPGESFQASTLGPIPVLDRVEIIDVLRGFALSGVLLANMVWLSQEVALTSAQVAALPTADIDRWSRYLVQFLIDGKFVTLFAFLFGLGFSVQLVRAEVRGTSVVPVYTRRLLILLAFGAMHTYLLWYGDILLFYALLGFPLILFRFRAERTLLICGVALAVAVPVLVLAIQGGMASGGDAAAAALASAEDARVKADRFAAFTTGTYLDVLPENAKVNSGFWLAGIFLFALPHMFGKFVLGFYAGRLRLLHDAASHLPLFRRVLWWGLALGLLGNGGWVFIDIVTDTAVLDESFMLVTAAHVLEYTGMLALAGFYLSAIVLIAQRPSWQRRLARLGAVGRMALSNYLLQTAVHLFIFYGFGIGLGLMGTIGTAGCVLLSIGVFVLQVLYSNWWLKQFRFGPAEWLWRSLTYWKPQPMRIARGVGTTSIAV